MSSDLRSRGLGSGFSYDRRELNVSAKQIIGSLQSNLDTLKTGPEGTQHLASDLQVIVDEIKGLLDEPC